MHEVATERLNALLNLFSHSSEQEAMQVQI